MKSQAGEGQPHEVRSSFPRAMIPLDWGFVDRKAWDPQWEHVLIFLAGNLDAMGVARLLELLADEDKDDLLRHRLALAVCCLPEIAEPARSCNEPTIN